MTSWPPVAPRDTTREIAAVQLAIWKSRSESERARWWFDRIHSMDLARHNLLAARHPDAPESELMALWTEQTYRGKVDPDFLARACAAIRAGVTAPERA